MDKGSFADEIASVFTTEGVRLNKLDPASEEAQQAHEMEHCFTTGAAFLRVAFPNERVKNLMNFVWDVVGGQRVPVVLGPRVQSISIAMIGTKDAATKEVTGTRAVIMLPQDWLAKIKENPLLQLGAIVFVGSQSVDFVHGRVHGVKERAFAYEAEYLKTLQKMLPQWKPNDYQHSILKNYADGLDTEVVKPLLYTMKPIEKLN